MKIESLWSYIHKVIPKLGKFIELYNLQELAETMKMRASILCTDGTRC